MVLAFCVTTLQWPVRTTRHRLPECGWGCEGFRNSKKTKVLEDSRVLRLNSCPSPLPQSTTLNYLVEPMFSAWRFPRERQPVLQGVVSLSTPLLCCLPGATQVVSSHCHFFLGSKLERVSQFEYFFSSPVAFS